MTINIGHNNDCLICWFNRRSLGFDRSDYDNNRNKPRKKRRNIAVETVMDDVCEGRRKYASKFAATNHGDDNQHPYWCEECGGWHSGHIEGD